MKQTYTDYELIVINDNPLDKAKIDVLIRKFNNVQVIHHLFSKGGNAARNSGILRSKGELIAFLDDDDVWLPEKLAYHFQEHENNPDVGLIFSECLYVYNNAFIRDHASISTLPVDIVEAMKAAQFCPATSSIVSIRRECTDKCGFFDETLESLQDWDYWFRIAHYFKLFYIPKVLVYFNQHLGDRTSHNEDKRRRGINQICTKWKDEIDTKVFTKNLTINMYSKKSRNALMTGNKYVAFKNSLKLLNKNVLSIKSIKSFIKINLDIIY